MRIFSRGAKKDMKTNPTPAEDAVIAGRDLDDCIDVQPRVNINSQPWWIGEDEFYDIADIAFEGLPKSFSQGIDNVAIQVLPEPQPQYLKRLAPGHELLGLYVGVSAVSRSGGYGYLNMPDAIYLYSGPIHRVSRNGVELREQIRRTLWHEIGHYHGMSDAELRAVGY